jgi:hypothetical protein
VGASFAFGIGIGHFTFVAMDHFHDHNPGHFRMEHREVTRIYNTTVINNTIIRGNNHNLINRGVPVDRVAAASHQDIRPIRVQAGADGPRNAQLGRDGRSLAVYRPDLPAPKPGQAPRLVGEGVKPAPQFNLRSRVEQGQARATGTRTPSVNGPNAAATAERRPVVGNQNVNRPDNVVRDNRANQPNTERQGSLIMRGGNQPDRQTPVANQNPAQNAPADLRRGQQDPLNSATIPDRGDNRRVVTPPMTPGGPPYRGQSDSVRQNPSQDINQRNVTRPDIEQQQGQQRQLLQQQQRDLQQQQQQQQRQIQLQQQQQLRDLQQQQRDFQQQQRQQRDIQTPPTVPRQEVPSRSYEPPRSEGTPRMQENRSAPEMRSAPQYSAPATRSDNGGGGRGDSSGSGRSGGGGGGGNGNSGGNGNGNNGNNNNGNGNGNGGGGGGGGGGRGR